MNVCEIVTQNKKFGVENIHKKGYLEDQKQHTKTLASENNCKTGRK